MKTIDEIKKILTQQLVSFDAKILEIILALKQEAINKLDEDAANELWCLEHTFLSKKEYITIFNNIKCGKYELAWSELSQLEISLQYIFNNFGEDNFIKYGLEFIRNNVFSFQQLFPFFLFISREAVIQQESCNICGKIITIRSRCEHKPGKLYMGELCLRNVEKLELNAFAIVKNPEDKYAVLTPEDKEYDYEMLKILSNNIQGPYERIIVNTKKIIKFEFKDTGRNEKCPCGSGLKYKKCCLGKECTFTDHKEIVFNHPIKAQNFKYISSFK